MPENTQNPRSPKPTSEQPDVQEPSNVRHPSKPTPDQPPEPQEAGRKGSSEEEQDTFGE